MSDRWNMSGGEGSVLSLEIRGFAVSTHLELADHVERLYEEHYDPVYRFLILTGSSRADADEIVQEAFLRLLRFFAAGNTIDEPRHWLLRVCHNIRCDEARRESRRPPATEHELANQALHEADSKPDPEAVALEHERFELVRLAMTRLNARQREFLLLRAEGMKLREIAEMYGVSVQSVAESCGRAMEKLGRLVK
jgi:RNA polymerase sigma-70 factor (ECF subfamily)